MLHTVCHIHKCQHRQKDCDQKPHLSRLVSKTQGSCVDQWERQENWYEEGDSVNENPPFAEIVDNASKIESLEYSGCRTLRPNDVPNGRWIEAQPSYVKRHGEEKRQ